MKYIALFLIALIGIALAGEVIPPGYKSGEMELEDGQTDAYQIPITGHNGDFCNPNSNAGVTCVVAIKYDKHTAGEQKICIGWEQETECDDTKASYVTNIATDSRTTTFYYEYAGGMDFDQTLYVTVTGKCRVSTTTTPCYQTTDSDIESVRIFEAIGTNGGDLEDASQYSDIRYVPFVQDDDGSNTAKYTVDAAATDAFVYPSMVFDVATGGEDHYIKLDIDESVLDSQYAVEFHYVFEAICGDSRAANASNCMWNVTEYANSVVPQGTANWENPQTGDYTSGPNQLAAGMWSVTPYVYSENVQSSLDFFYCGGLGAECASASGLAPSIALFAMLLALIALLF